MIYVSLLAALGLALSAEADVVGVWATPANGGMVEISRCGQALCGTLLSSDQIRANPAVLDLRNRVPGLRSRPLKGLALLSGFTGGPKKWSGGKVYNPEDGATYSGSMELTDADSLRLKGCIVAPLCKTQVWKRVD